MGFFQSITNFFKPKRIVHEEIDPESIRTHNTIQALANENASLKGEKAKLLSELGESRESEKDEEEENEVRVELDRQKKELRRKVYPSYFSCGALFRKMIRDKSFRRKLAFYSFDRATDLGKFGDIGFSADGDIVLLNSDGEVLLKAKELNHLFQSVGGLGNDVQTFKIPINVDSDGGYVENLQVTEMAEIVPIKGKFQYSKARKRELYKYVQELQNDLADKNSYIEELEITTTDLKKEVDDLKVSQRVAENQSETLRKELGQAEKSVTAIQKVFRSTEKELTQLRDIKSIHEENIDKLEAQLKKAMEEAEKEGTKTSFAKALEITDKIKRSVVRDEPSVKIVEVPTKSAENRENITK